MAWTYPGYTRISSADDQGYEHQVSEVLIWVARKAAKAGHPPLPLVGACEHEITIGPPDFTGRPCPGCRAVLDPPPEGRVGQHRLRHPVWAKVFRCARALVYPSA